MDLYTIFVKEKLLHLLRNVYVWREFEKKKGISRKKKRLQRGSWEMFLALWFKKPGVEYTDLQRRIRKTKLIQPYLTKPKLNIPTSDLHSW